MTRHPSKTREGRPWFKIPRRKDEPAPLNTVPPWIKETVNYIQKKGQEPLYQAITTGMELPIKYGTDAKNNTSDFYQGLQNYNAQHAQAMAQFRPTFQKIQDLVTAGQKDEAQKMLADLSDEEYALYKDLKTASSRSDTSKNEAQFLPTYRKIQGLVQQETPPRRINCCRDSPTRITSTTSS